MTTKHIVPKTSIKGLLKSLFGSRTRRRIEQKSSEEFRRLSPTELRRIGLSPTSERYIEKTARRLTKALPTLTKRQFQQKQLSETAGRSVTLERRAREYLSGERKATSAAQATLRERSIEAWSLRRKYKFESVPRIREHLRNMEAKARGDHLEQDIYFREKAFSEAHREVPEEQAAYQKWFNYGHVNRAARGSHDATGRSIR